MTYEITIAGKTETSHPELLAVGNRVRFRVFSSSTKMAYDGSSAIEYVGTVVDVEEDEGYREVTMRQDNGKRAGFAVKINGSHDDRIVQEA